MLAITPPILEALEEDEVDVVLLFSADAVALLAVVLLLSMFAKAASPARPRLANDVANTAKSVVVDRFLSGFIS